MLTNMSKQSTNHGSRPVGQIRQISYICLLEKNFGKPNCSLCEQRTWCHDDNYTKLCIGLQGMGLYPGRVERVHPKGALFNEKWHPPILSLQTQTTISSGSWHKIWLLIISCLRSMKSLLIWKIRQYVSDPLAVPCTAPKKITEKFVLPMQMYAFSCISPLTCSCTTFTTSMHYSNFNVPYFPVIVR